MTVPGRLVVVCAVLSASPAMSQDAPEPRPSWGLTNTLGYGGAGGDFGDLLEKPVTGDFNIFRNRGAWRFGMGMSFTSFTMKEPYQDEKEWGFQRTYLFATRMLRSEASKRLRPYLQLRGGAARLHPRSELFAFEPPPEEPGDSPTTPRERVGRGPRARSGDPPQQVAGPRCLRSLRLLQRLRVRPEPGRTSRRASSGTTFEARFGVRWHPDDGWPSGPPAAAPPRARARRLGRLAKTWAGPPPRPSPSTGRPRASTSTCATRTSTRSARGAGGTTSSTASPTTTTSSRPTSTSIPGTGRRTTTRPRQRLRLLGLRALRARRGLLLGVLRRDPPHVLQRHDLHRHRWHRGG